MWLRQSTASQEILLGPFLDSTDGNTQETGLTIANTDIQLWKEGATAEASKNSGGATHIANGRYYAVLDATDTNTLGKLEVNVHVTGALAVRREFMVVPANVYDSLILGTDTLNADVTQWLGTAVATPTTAGVPEVDATYFNGVAYSTALAAEVDAIWDEPIVGHLTAGTAGLSEALGSAAIVDSTVTGTPTTTTFDFTGGSTTNNFYNDQLVYILSGTGIGQVRPVLSSSYSGGTTTITVDEAWVTTPAASDRFAILVSHVHPKSQITADIDANSTQLAAILADTAEIGASGAGLTDLGGMSTAMKAQVNAEIVDALATDTYAEPSAVPAATATLADKLSFLAAALRNKTTQTSTTLTIRNDADSADIAAATVSDSAGTFTKGEFV